MKNKLRGSILLLLTTIIWGSAFVSQKTAMEHMPPFSFQAIRSFLGFLIMIPLVALFDRNKRDGKSFLMRWKSKELWKAGLLCGIFLFTACNLQQFALVDVAPGKSGFLTAMYIVFVPIIGLVRGKRVSKWMPLSIALAIFGLYLLCCVETLTIQTGDILLLGCAVAFAVQINVVDNYVNRIDALRMNAIQILVCTTLSAICAVTTEQVSFSEVVICFPEIAHVGFLSMGVCYGMQILGQRDLDQAPAALIMSLEAAFALLFDWLILKTNLSTEEIWGCIILFIAIIPAQIEPKTKKN